MAASAPVPKDLPREAEASLDEHQHLNNNSSLSDLSDDDDDSSSSDDHDAHDDQHHGHSHAHGNCNHPHGAHSHAHYDDEPRQHVRFSQTPAGGMILNILDSIPLVTSIALRLLPLTNAIAFVLAATHLLAQPASSACAISLLPPSGKADWGRLVLSLLFDNSYSSFFGSLFAVYELGSRLETLKSSLHFALLSTAYALAAATAYYLLLLWVPGLAAFDCSVGCWPVVLALAVTESLHNRLAPRSFPLFPYPVPPLAFPFLLLLAEQLLFGVHPFVIVGLCVGWVLHWPLDGVVGGLSVVLERGWCAAWLGGRSGYVSVAQAGKMPPWAPINKSVSQCSANAVVATNSSRS